MDSGYHFKRNILSYIQRHPLTDNKTLSKWPYLILGIPIPVKFYNVYIVCIFQKINLPQQNWLNVVGKDRCLCPYMNKNYGKHSEFSWTLLKTKGSVCLDLVQIWRFQRKWSLKRKKSMNIWQFPPHHYGNCVIEIRSSSTKNVITGPTDVKDTGFGINS